ncbi:DNA cytosine methyltransferase [Candidatus Atelocyanobacterium thalassae]|uniref:Cytosine-specific methyltransferase n=1 Tax=cyanobacterium endosymbiont of Braarudosphaera bigelowii TaxID=1285375 RepID=A0ABM7U4U0_9CHRO|nr:DNA cytosine methyltransferase [Candidatus Atelocyanobacterium thalassa]BDA39714.1 modification methylase BspRI [cyanobacterium endosymbiont of Braarudosphaera bigelowii]
MNQKRPIAIDLFAGVGGMTLGFEQAGFDVLGAIEIDPIHCAVHQYNFPFWTTICSDVSIINAMTIKNLSHIGDRDIDVVFGGPPCQGFSSIGKRDPKDSRNDLVKHFIRLVLELQPKYFVIENVPGMATKNNQIFLEEIFNKFNANNYQIQTNYRILNSANYGVPQIRKRLFLLGAKSNLPLPKYPQFLTNYERNVNFTIPFTPTVSQAISNLPEVNYYPELNYKDWIKVNYFEHNDYVQSILNSSDNFSYQRIYDKNLLTSSLRTKHTKKLIERFQKTPQGQKEPISRFFKLHPEGFCNTLRAGTPSNRGSYTSPRPIHPFTPRCITVREAARLHSYPDWFRFHVTKWHGFRQVGNSVPPLLARAIAKEIIKALDILPIKPVVRYRLKDEERLSFNNSQAASYYNIDANVIGKRIKKKQIT